MRGIILLALPLFVASKALVPEFYNIPSKTKDFAALTIAAFNIQVLGVTKMGKPEVVEQLVRILKRHDLCLIQEIRDSSQTAIYDLLDALNADSFNQYSMELSERLGRTSSKEQYAFFYKHAIFDVNSIHQWPDVRDVFERPPYTVVFRASGYSLSTFAYMGIHVKPDDAVAEIDAMVDVYDGQTGQTGTTNWILGGDLNADCSYVSASDWSNIRLRTDNRFTWKINDLADTTLAASSCAYDRFVTTGSIGTICPTATVFNYWDEYNLSEELAKDVSDHYPVELGCN